MENITGSEEEDPFVQRFRAMGDDIKKTLRLQRMTLRAMATRRGREVSRWRIAHPNATWEQTARTFGVSSTYLRELRRKGHIQ